MAYRPIVAVMEEKDTVDESGVGDRQSLARQSIVSIMSLDKCPTVITYYEDSCKRYMFITVYSILHQPYLLSFAIGDSFCNS